jgi:hypothetical protein
MNRIYQGRVSKVEILKSGTKGKAAEYEAMDPDTKAARAAGEKLLWEHHQLFQDAVNYYITALASLGSSPESPLTRLQGLLVKVWDSADKKGQRRSGMRDSLQRAWQLPEPPTLDQAIVRFRQPLLDDGVLLNAAETAGHYLLHKLGGDAAIQQGGRDFLPMFCDPGFTGTFKLSALRRGRANDEARLQTELHRELTDSEIRNLPDTISLASVVNLQPDVAADTGEAAAARLREAAKSFPDEVPERVLTEWLAALPEDFALPRRRGGNINLKRVDACSLFLAFPNQTTKRLFQSTYKAPKAHPQAAANRDDQSEGDDRFIVEGEDPIKLARGTRGVVFSAFTALPLWGKSGSGLAWKEFDIAAFKEALKVYNQFNQNVTKRAEKLDGLATKLLVMDGERAMEAYTAATDSNLLNLLQRVWAETKGKPVMPKADGGEEQATVRFAGDARIDRLRTIINDDLAEEYRLTEGRKTPYGLRRRTMKGWADVKRKWQSKVKAGMKFSPEIRDELQRELDALRGGEKREQIGSHKLFSGLLADEAAWSIWREPEKELADKIVDKEWAADPLEAFRQYCELRETLEEVSARPLNFTPADAAHSRRLFMFTDACSFGSDGGEYKHDLKALAVTVPVARKGNDGRYMMQNCRLSYSAPRLLRDRIRAADGVYVQDWAQPMMRALFGAGDEKINPQTLKDAAVQLMPDWDKDGACRMLLNFPLRLDEAAVTKLIGKAALWEKQFVTWKKGAQLPFLRWDGEFDGKEPHKWWEKTAGFTVLAADLGTRHTASMALVECTREKTATSRSLGQAGGCEWFGRFHSGKILQLPGEDADVLRRPSPAEEQQTGLEFRQECYGDRGRMANAAECEETLAMMAALGESKMLADVADAAALRKRFSFPEQNDKLLVAVRRAQKWIADCISWHWKLTQPESLEQATAALAVLREQKRVPEWSSLADGPDANTAMLREALHSHVINQRLLVRDNLLKLTGRILPLRGRDWEFVANKDWDRCWVLQQTARGSAPLNRKLMGQRGLSMARIEQVSELRRRWQSLNQSLRRVPGEKPPTAAEMRNDSIPDPCPDILRKLENLREQRVNQTANLILAQALGLKLTAPQTSKEARKRTDTHGEYKVARPPVDFIVLEDLSRYLSDQGRAKSENSRLMKWCHRQITDKVKMLAEPFGIPVLETPPAYSSRFCSLTGMAGFRAVEVSWADRADFRWRVRLEEISKAKLEGRALDAVQTAVNDLFWQLETISRSAHPCRTLLAPQPGGPMFVTAKPIRHPAPSKSKNAGGRPRLGGGDVLPQQADLNAAINLALRAVAHPSCAGIHHRLRTERKKAVRGETDTFTVKESRRFGKEKPAVEVKPGDYMPKERNPNLFYDPHGAAEFGRARIADDDHKGYPYASGPGIWKTANDREKQWARCHAINRQRLLDWDDDHLP